MLHRFRTHFAVGSPVVLDMRSPDALGCVPSQTGPGRARPVWWLTRCPLTKDRGMCLDLFYSRSLITSNRAGRYDGDMKHFLENFYWIRVSICFLFAFLNSMEMVIGQNTQTNKICGITAVARRSDSSTAAWGDKSNQVYSSYGQQSDVYPTVLAWFARSAQLRKREREKRWRAIIKLT